MPHTFFPLSPLASSDEEKEGGEIGEVRTSKGLRAQEGIVDGDLITLSLDNPIDPDCILEYKTNFVLLHLP